MTRIPNAIAPLVTTTNSSPAAGAAASWSAVPASTSMRSSPSLPATTLEPSFTTMRLMPGSLFGAPLGPAPAIARSAPALRGVELERHAADLDLVSGLEARFLQGSDHADAPQPALEVVHCVLVLGVVAREQDLDAAPPHREGAGAEALDAKPAGPGGPEHHVLGELLVSGGGHRRAHRLDRLHERRHRGEQRRAQLFKAEARRAGGDDPRPLRPEPLSPRRRGRLSPLGAHQVGL